MINLIHIIFYISVFGLLAVCVVTANNMSENTCACMRHCLKAILIGLVATGMAFWYDLNQAWLMLSCTPTLIGVSGWLLFDKYQAHEDLDLFVAKLKRILHKSRLI